jgi:TPR repeat protein
MVICTDKKYVFVKVYKTGGTSIYRELKKHSKSQYLLGTMYGNGTGVLQDYKTAVNAAEQGHDSGVKRKHDHVKSSWIKENAFPELGLDWDKYFKFGFVRNPWDRELSNPPEDISFKEWLNIRLQKNGFIRSHNSSQCDYLTDVNYVARFENYDEEVKYLFNRIGVPMPQPLMHINKTDHKPYYEYYDDIDIMKVQQWYEKDIEMYNYEFGE